MVHRQRESFPKLWPLVTFCLILVIALCVLLTLNPLAKAADEGRMAATEVQGPTLQASEPASTDAGPDSLNLPPAPDAVHDIRTAYLVWIVLIDWVAVLRDLKLGVDDAGDRRPGDENGWWVVMKDLLEVVDVGSDRRLVDG